MIESNKLHTDLHAFSQEIIAESVRNLDLLKDAGLTQSQLNRMAAQMVADTSFAGKAIIVIQELNIQMDVDGSLSEKLQQAQIYTNQLCDELGIMGTTNGHADSPGNGIEHASAEAITAADNLLSVLGILRTAVSSPLQTPEGIVSKFFVV